MVMFNILALKLHVRFSRSKCMGNLLIAIVSGIVILYIAWGLFCWRLSIARANDPEWQQLAVEETDRMYQELYSSRHPRAKA